MRAGTSPAPTSPADLIGVCRTDNDSSDARRREARRLYLRRSQPTAGEEEGERQDFLALCRYEFAP